MVYSLSVFAAAPAGYLLANVDSVRTKKDICLWSIAGVESGKCDCTERL